jgi:hypothetical protein
MVPAAVFFSLVLSGCPPSPTEIRINAQISDASRFNPQVLSAGMGDDSEDNFSIRFTGVTEEDRISLGNNFTLQSVDSAGIVLQNDVTYTVINDAGVPWVEYSSDPKLYYFEANVHIPVGLDPRIRLLRVKLVPPVSAGRLPPYQIPIPPSQQVLDHFAVHGTAADLQDPSVAPGAMAFLPGQERYLYVTVKESGISVLDTRTDVFQQPSVVDLAVANAGSDDVSVLLSKEDGTFEKGTASPFTVGDDPSALTTDFIDGDKSIDVAVASRSTDTVAFLLGR